MDNYDLILYLETKEPAPRLLFPFSLCYPRDLPKGKEFLRFCKFGMLQVSKTPGYSHNLIHLSSHFPSQYRVLLITAFSLSFLSFSALILSRLILSFSTVCSALSPRCSPSCSTAWASITRPPSAAVLAGCTSPSASTSPSPSPSQPSPRSTRLSRRTSRPMSPWGSFYASSS